MMGSLVKRMVSGMERIPEEISRAIAEQKKAIGRCRLQLAEIVNLMVSFVTNYRSNHLSRYPRDLTALQSKGKPT